MQRLADPDLLRAHVARFSAAAAAPAALTDRDLRRLVALREVPYADLTAAQVVEALELLAAAGYPRAAVGYFLPAVLRRPPLRDRLAAERFLAAALAVRGDPALEPWEPDVEATLARVLAARPLRGGDDPVDLWLSEAALHRHELRSARRLVAAAPARTGVAADWAHAAGAPYYPRVALAWLQRAGAAAEAQFLRWEAATDDAGARAWVEVMFHVHGEGWRPEPASLDRLLDDPRRRDAADALVAHPEADVAVGAAAVGVLLAPRRARELGARVAGRLATLDASDQDRFVLVPTVARLLGVPAAGAVPRRRRLR